MAEVNPMPNTEQERRAAFDVSSDGTLTIDVSSLAPVELWNNEGTKLAEIRWQDGRIVQDVLDRPALEAWLAEGPARRPATEYLAGHD